MQTNPESAAVEAVEAVAWAMTDYQADGANTQFTRDRHAAEYWGEQGIQIDPLYPQSALDALRGEAAAAERRVAELEAKATKVLSVIDQKIYWRERECESIRNTKIKVSLHNENLRIHEICLIELGDIRAALTKEST